MGKFLPTLSVAALLLSASAATACINDRSTVRTEQEFKKNYEFKSDNQPQPILSFPLPVPDQRGPAISPGDVNDPASEYAGQQFKKNFEFNARNQRDQSVTYEAPAAQPQWIPLVAKGSGLALLALAPFCMCFSIIKSVRD
jgi:hypothetical protein